MGRGPQRLSEVQLARLDVVRRRYVEWVQATGEWEAREARMRAEFLGGVEEVLREAVRAAVDVRVPASRIKQAAGVSDHRTYQNRFLSGYEVRPVAGWDLSADENDSGKVALTRFLHFTPLELVFGLQGDQVVVVGRQDTPAEQDLATALAASEFGDEWASMLRDAKIMLEEK